MAPTGLKEFIEYNEIIDGLYGISVRSFGCVLFCRVIHEFLLERLMHLDPSNFVFPTV